MKTHTDRAYEEELGKLREELLLMGAKVESMVAASVRAFTERDYDLARRTIECDHEVNRLEVEYKADYRGVKDKLAEIANTRRQILREIIGEASARDIAAAILSARQDEIRRKIEDETHRLDRISRQLVRYQELQHEIRVAREEHSRMSADLSSAEQFENQEAGSITIAVIDPARVPDVRRPAFPNTPLYVSLAAVVALLMGVAYAFVADYYDHTFRSIAEAERYLGVPVVGSIGTRRKGLLRRL